MQKGGQCCANAKNGAECTEPGHAPGCPYPIHGVCGCGAFDPVGRAPQWNQQATSPCPPLICEPIGDTAGYSTGDNKSSMEKRTIPRSYMIRPEPFRPASKQLELPNSYVHENPLIEEPRRSTTASQYSPHGWDNALAVTTRDNPYPDLTATFPNGPVSIQAFRASNYRMCHPDLTGWSTTTHVRYTPTKQELAELRREQTRLQHLPESNCRWRPSLTYSDKRPRVKADLPVDNERRPPSPCINYMYSDYYNRPPAKLTQSTVATADHISYTNPTLDQFTTKITYPLHPSNHPTAYSDSKLRTQCSTVTKALRTSDQLLTEADMLNKSATIGTFTTVNFGATPSCTKPLNFVTGRECVSCQAH